MVSFHGQKFSLHLHHLHEGSVAVVSVHQPLVLVLLVHLEVYEHQVRAQDLPAVAVHWRLLVTPSLTSSCP